MGYEQAENERRARNLARIGSVFAVDYNGESPLYRVEDGDYKSGWLYGLNSRSGGDREADLFEIGEQVGFINIAGGDIGFIVGAVPHQASPCPAHSADVHTRHYKDGAIVEYNREAHHYDINLPDSGSVAITAPAGVEINVSGGHVVVKGGDVIADGVSLKNHVHGGVKVGTGKTQKPL